MYILYVYNFQKSFKYIATLYSDFGHQIVCDLCILTLHILPGGGGGSSLIVYLSAGLFELTTLGIDDPIKSIVKRDGSKR